MLLITTALVVLYAFVTTRTIIGRQMIYAVASTSTISAAVQREAARGQHQRDHRRLFGERAFELVKHDREHDEAANERALPECVDSQQQETVADHLD